MLKDCGKCGTIGIYVDAPRCPHCGADLGSQVTQVIYSAPVKKTAAKIEDGE
jgi:hypothetical protein